MVTPQWPEHDLEGSPTEHLGWGGAVRGAEHQSAADERGYSGSEQIEWFLSASICVNQRLKTVCEICLICG
jgi:hypothetical protein